MWGQGVVFPVLDHTWSLGTNSWICSTRGNGTLSSTNLDKWFITLPICCEISSPLTWGKFFYTCVIMGRAYHIQFCTENSHRTVGSSWVWAGPLETSLPRNNQSLRSTWRDSLSVSNWFLPPYQISGTYMLYVISTWCLKFWLLVILKQLRKLSHCPIQCAKKSKSENSLPKQAQGYFWCSFNPARKAYKHPENAHTMTSKEGMVISVNSTSRCWKENMAFSWIPGGFCLCWEGALTCEQAMQFWDFVLHREERKGSKKYFQINSPSLSWPRWVPWCVWLTSVDAKSFGANNLSPGNSHHPFSGSMAFSALASWFWVSVYFGKSSVSSGRFANMRALIGFPLVTPLLLG